MCDRRRTATFSGAFVFHTHTHTHTNKKEWTSTRTRNKLTALIKLLVNRNSMRALSNRHMQ